MVLEIVLEYSHLFLANWKIKLKHLLLLQQNRKTRASDN